jgi:hypothetical protein
MKTKILIYGLQRSGTNYLETLLKKRYKVKFVNDFKNRSSLSHKHARLYDQKDRIPTEQYRNNVIIKNFEDYKDKVSTKFDFIIVLSKDPYSWLLSYKRWAKKCDWPKVDHHYLEEYNLFYSKLLEFSKQSEDIIFVRYRDLIKDTEEVLSQMEQKMKLKERSLFKLQNSKIKKVNCSDKFTKDRRDYYLKRHYLKEFSEEQLDEVETALDERVVRDLGYNIPKK